MINRIVGLHFSPRGGTATITEKLIYELADDMAKECGSEISCELYDLFRGSDLPVIDDSAVVVIGMPAVIGKLPLPALDKIKNMQGKGAMTLALVSYGTMTYGNALYELYRAIEEQGFKVVGAGAFVARHTGLTDSVLKRPDMDDFEILREFANAATGKLKRLAGCDIEGLKIKPAPINIKGSVPIHRISRISPKAAVIAENTIEKIYRLRNEPEWYL